MAASPGPAPIPGTTEGAELPLPDLRRIGDKLISREKIMSVIDQVLTLRQAGLSQQEVAARLGTDRSFISRLEGLGEVRKGGSIALVGFPVANKDELLAVAREKGVDFTFLLDERERWSFLEEKSGLELFAEVVSLMEKVRGHQVVIILGHNQPARILAALAERQAACRSRWISPFSYPLPPPGSRSDS